MTYLWSRRPWWLVDTCWLGLCAYGAHYAWSRHEYGAFGFAMLTCGLQFSGIVYQGLPMTVRASRDAAWELAEKARLAATESHQTLLVAMPLLEQAAVIVAERAPKPKEQVN